MTLRSFATVALILVPSLAFAGGGGGGTGVSNGGNGSPGGANSDVSNGNTPPSAANNYFGTEKSDAPGAIGASKDMMRKTGESQKAP